jgi:hypothetical protein
MSLMQVAELHHVQVAETVRFGASCMVDDQIPHFARLKTHDQGIGLAI